MGVLGVFFGCRGDGGFMLVCSSGRRGVIGFNVATSQQPVREKVRPARLGVWVSAKKFALLGLIVGVSAKKLALRTKNGPQSAFYDVLGEVFRGTVAERTVLGEFFRGNTAGGAVPGELFRGHAPEGTVPGGSCRRQAAAGSRRPPTRAPAPRERGNPATASCRKKTPTPRRRLTRSG